MLPRALAPLLLAALSLPAQADQLLSGDYIQIYYDGSGLWNSDESSAGFQVRADPRSGWVDATYPGTPWFVVAFAYSYEGSEYELLGESASPYTEWTTVEESDLSSGTTNTAYYRWTAGLLVIEKTETWEDAGTAVRLTYAVTNTGAHDVSDFRINTSLDPDHDYSRYSSFNTLMDTMDLDGDGQEDWVQAVGPSSGWTLAWGACGSDGEEFGAAGWPTEADAALSDYAGSSADDTIHWRRTLPAIAAGATESFSALFVFGATASEAAATYLADRDELCATVAVDEDADGYFGDDCDDTNADVHPGAVEVCDDIDNDCDGTVDVGAVDAATWYQDDDGDGYGGELEILSCDPVLGYADNDEDCDDGDATVYPGAPELADGIDNDCDGIDEREDTDGDGLPDELEEEIGTNPRDADSDGDGVPDGLEVGDPRNPTDTDEDGVIDALDTDDDGDGILTEVEVQDYDWTVDGSVLPDTDEDGKPDYLDTDSDGDGKLDVVEGTGDEDCDGVANYIDADDADGSCDTAGDDTADDDTAGDDTAGDDTAGDEKEKDCGCATGSPLGGLGWLLPGLLIVFRRRRP